MSIYNMNNYIPYGRQVISDQDVEAVIRVLRSEYLTQGPAIPSFENRLIEYCGVRHAVAMNSATSALHVAYLALGLTAGDVIWTTPITFVATANAALYCNATVDFVDVDLETANMSMAALEEKLFKCRRNKSQLPKIVVPVHMGGYSCDMRKLHELSREYGFFIVEDASHAIGGSYGADKIGACSYSHITVFSFHPVKIITTGEGGAAVTNDVSLAEAMRMLRSHGVTRDTKLLSKFEGWWYEQHYLGFNYRMTDMQAALGSSQISGLDAFVERRRYLARRYCGLLADLRLRSFTQESVIAQSSNHLFIVQLVREDQPKRNSVFEAMRCADIGVNVHYIPVYFQPFYKRMGFSEGYCQNAEEYYNGAITLPLYPELTDEQQDYVVEKLGNALSI